MGFLNVGVWDFFDYMCYCIKICKFKVILKEVKKLGNIIRLVGSIDEGVEDEICWVEFGCVVDKNGDGGGD